MIAGFEGRFTESSLRGRLPSLIGKFRSEPSHHISAGTSIGSVVIGGTPKSVLYLNASGLLSQSAGLLYDDTISFFYTDFIQNVTSLNGLNIQAIDDSALTLQVRVMGRGQGPDKPVNCYRLGKVALAGGTWWKSVQFNAGNPKC
jgi:hypothetical protein